MGAVLWRITDQPGGALNYRFYERRTIDAVQLAIDGNLLKADLGMIPLLRRWSQPWYKYTPVQSCDFDAEKGLSKIWVFMGSSRPLNDMLQGCGIREITQHEPHFRVWGLKIVRFAAFEFQSQTVNFYFRVPGELTETMATEYVRMAGCPPLSTQEFATIASYQNLTTGFTLAVTIRVTTGEIERVAFYALGLPQWALPEVNEKVQTFFREAPSYDEEEFKVIGWSFGRGGKKYVKAEKGYCGGVVPLIKGWNAIFVSDQ